MNTNNNFTMEDLKNLSNNLRPGSNYPLPDWLEIISALSTITRTPELLAKYERESKEKEPTTARVYLPYLSRKDNATFLANKRKADRSINWSTYFNNGEKVTSPFKDAEPAYERLTKDERTEIFENEFYEGNGLEFLGTEKFRRSVFYRLSGFCKKVNLPFQHDDLEDLVGEFTLYVIEHIEEYFQYVSTTVEPCGVTRFFLYRLYDIVRKYNNGNKICRSLDAYLEKAGDCIPDERGSDLYYTTEGTLAERKEKILAEVKRTFTDSERKFLTSYITGKKLFPYFYAPGKVWNKRTRKSEELPSIAMTATRKWNTKFGYIFYIRSIEAPEEKKPEPARNTLALLVKKAK